MSAAGSGEWQEAEARARAELDREHPPAWTPEPGETIVGRMVGFQPSVFTVHGNVPVVTLEGPNGGRRSVWLIHKVLRRAFARENVVLGEIVAIRYLGKKDPAGPGQPYADYKVGVDRNYGDAAAPDWAAVLAAHDDDPIGDDVAAPPGYGSNGVTAKQTGSDGATETAVVPAGAPLPPLDDDIPF